MMSAEIHDEEERMNKKPAPKKKLSMKKDALKDLTPKKGDVKGGGPAPTAPLTTVKHCH